MRFKGKWLVVDKCCNNVHQFAKKGLIMAVGLHLKLDGIITQLSDWEYSWNTVYQKTNAFSNPLSYCSLTVSVQMQ